MDLDELLTRGVDKIYPSKEDLEKVLKSGKKLKLYQGFDPTGTRLHIGHMVGFRKLRQWQDAGHHVIFLIGDGTGQAGDPSGKTSTRDKFLTRDELRKNATDYVKQAGKIVRFDGENPVEILFNGDWLNKLELADILEIAGHFSLQQLSERDLYQERIKKGESVSLREFLYPLLQAYDSVEMDVDLELGGTDQTFNMLAGRSLMKAMRNKDKFVMTTPLLTDSEGRKIGKTEGNVIGLTDEPQDLYGKIMSLSDDVIVKSLEYLTDIPMSKVKSIGEKIDKGENPIQFKKILAFEIVKQLNDEKKAKEAQEHFEKTVQSKEEMETTTMEVDLEVTNILSDVLVSALNLFESNSELKRMVGQKGIKLNGEVVDNLDIEISNGDVISIGRRRNIQVKSK